MTKMLKAIHANTAISQPMYLPADTAFSIGDILEFSYFVREPSSSRSDYQSAFLPKGREVPGHFLVSDLFVCTVPQKSCVFVELTALDPHFRMLYPVERVMLLAESELLSRLRKPAAI